MLWNVYAISTALMKKCRFKSGEFRIKLDFTVSFHEHLSFTHTSSESLALATKDKIGEFLIVLVISIFESWKLNRRRISRRGTERPP